MTLDHLGTYLFPDTLWLRAVGRVSFFIFFFLLGVNASARVPIKWWLASLCVVGLQLIHQSNALPLNIMFTAIACRSLLATCEHYRLIARYPYECFAACVVLHLPLMWVWDYGGIALMFTLAGRLSQSLRARTSVGILVASVGLYALFQAISFEFHGWHIVLMLALLGLSAYSIARENFWQALQLPKRLASPLRFLSRHSLEYYVLHVAALIVLANK